MLLPALSSKCDVPLQPNASLPGSRSGLDTISEIVSGPILISAYDVACKLIAPPDYAPVIFLDSGGYEALIDDRAAKQGDRRGVEKMRWTEEMYLGALSEFKCSQPVVAVSYDHPDARLTMDEQLDRAERLFEVRKDFIQEFLIKPEPDANVVDFEVLKTKMNRLSSFPIIGVTDKELGSTLLEKMILVGRLRRALDDVNSKVPIHVFGSLDPLTAPIYQISGADIFDGLAWLRYAFTEGRAIYPQNYDAMRMATRTNQRVSLTTMWNDNYTYLASLEDEMRRFSLEEDYSQFKFDGDLLRQASIRLAESLKV